MEIVEHNFIMDNKPNEYLNIKPINKYIIMKKHKIIIHHEYNFLFFQIKLLIIFFEYETRSEIT